MNTVTLPWMPKECSPNARVHWAKKSKAAKSYRAQCFYLAKMAKLKADWKGGIYLHLEFCPPSNQRRDLDNCLASFKNGMDGLADALGVDDMWFRIYMAMGEKVKGGCVRVRAEK